jgi:SAM-dependent methyltransferase
MIRLRHFLHPLKSTNSLYRRMQASASNRVTHWIMDREYRGITRTVREKCWCGGELQPFKWHASYGVCAKCGCYVNRRPPLPEALKEVYTFRRYWRVRQKMKGHPQIEQRAEMYKSDGRLDYWLSLVDRFAPTNGRVIEIGCSPGVLLAEMRRRNYECIGVEPDEETAAWIERKEGVEVRTGFFPGVSLPPCDLFMAFDVAEHVPDPPRFWKGISDLLAPSGIAILQTPVECHDYDHPFKERPEWFDDLEHLFLFTDRAVRKLAASANLELVALEDAKFSLGQVCVLRKSSA